MSLCKDKVYVPPLPTDLEELKTRITDDMNAVKYEYV